MKVALRGSCSNLFQLGLKKKKIWGQGIQNFIVRGENKRFKKNIIYIFIFIYLVKLGGSIEPLGWIWIHPWQNNSTSNDYKLFHFGVSRY